MKKFDLNIEKILENWEIKHAVREVIANAIDEQKLTNTTEIEIFKDSSLNWHIKDYGRGLKYEHFTQKENDEKLNHDGIIGKFGIGLKDALATFERKGIDIKMQSKFGDITLGKSQKTGFDDLITLHAYISEPSNPTFIGTEFELKNISDSDIQLAKNLFLKFTNEKVIEKTKNGEVLQQTGNQANIYINGVLVAVEDNFLFSYNITNLTATIKKAINRERTNVGRTAYANSIKAILLECESEEIGNSLSSDLTQYSYGNSHDELKWIDVQQHAANILNKYKKVVFVTADEIERGTDLVNEARQGGSDIVVIPTNLRDKIAEQNINESDANKVRIFSEFVSERNENFEFKFVSISDLIPSEKIIFDLKDKLISFIGGKPSNLKDILISETMQKDDYTFQPTEGVWSHTNGYGNIIIKRSVLKDEERFIAVLFHELAHVISGESDSTRRFESELTRLLGILGKIALKANIDQHILNAKYSDDKNIENKKYSHESGRIRVKSHNIHSVGYDSEKMTLQIEFLNGGVYEYQGVPENVFIDLMKVESKGRFAIANIYPNYPFEVIG